MPAFGRNWERANEGVDPPKPVETARTRENPFWAVGAWSACYRSGPGSRERHHGQRHIERPQRQAGHMAAPTSGKHNLKKNLANGGPSTHGPIPADLKGPLTSNISVAAAKFRKSHTFRLNDAFRTELLLACTGMQ